MSSSSISDIIGGGGEYAPPPAHGAFVVTLGAYVAILFSLFLSVPLCILLYRRRAAILTRTGVLALLARAGHSYTPGGSTLQPPSPFAAQLEAFLQKTVWGFRLDIVQAVLSLLSCVLFIYTSYTPPNVPEQAWSIILEVLITLYFLGDGCLRFYLSHDRFVYYWTPFALLDWWTTIPLLCGLTISGLAGFAPNAWLLARTLRVLRVLRVVRMLRLVDAYYAGAHAYARQMALLITMVLSACLVVAGIYQVAESTEATGYVPFHLAMLYSVITVVGRCVGVVGGEGLHRVSM